MEATHLILACTGIVLAVGALLALEIRRANAILRRDNDRLGALEYAVCGVRTEWCPRCAVALVPEHGLGMGCPTCGYPNTWMKADPTKPVHTDDGPCEACDEDELVTMSHLADAASLFNSQAAKTSGPEALFRARVYDAILKGVMDKGSRQACTNDVISATNEVMKVLRPTFSMESTPYSKPMAHDYRNDRDQT